METVAQSVAASLSERSGTLSRVFWLAIRLPLMQKQLLRKSRGLNQKIAQSNLRLIEVAGAIKFDGEKQVDPDLHIRDTLESIKHNALDFREFLLSRNLDGLLARGKTGVLLVREIKQTIALTCESVELANKVQWQIAEHDADIAVRHDGFVASSADELAALLDRF
ncbi:hypothetical protein [Burkholderia cenocepacia]|nr:hypothetical protein [Burkholderia cenocepacia]